MDLSTFKNQQYLIRTGITPDPKLCHQHRTSYQIYCIPHLLFKVIKFNSLTLYCSDEEHDKGINITLKLQHNLKAHIYNINNHLDICGEA